MTIDIAAVVKGYVDALLWTSACNGTAPTGDCEHRHATRDPQDCDASLMYIGYDADDIADSARREIETEVTDFVTGNAADIRALVLNVGDCDEGSIGHNFLLSRNHEGTGFWDRGWGERGDRLHAAADPYGTMNAYVGDDGRVYVMS